MPAEKEQQQETKPNTRVRGNLRDQGGSRGGKRGTGRLASLSGGTTEKMVFKPKAAPRRTKREAPQTSPVIKQEVQEPAKPQKPPVRKRKPELIQRVAGPFSQGPATIGNGQRSTGSTFLGNDRGGVKSEYGNMADADDPSVKLSVLDLNDVYEQEHELVVQTEEEAVERAEQAKHTGELDYQTGQKVAELVELSKSEDHGMMVFQMPPELPVFEDTVKVEDDEKGIDGRIGSLAVFKSGAVKMRLRNGILMDVSRGAKCGFMRGILAHQHRDTEHSAYLLGNVECQFLCSPDLESVI